MAKKRKGKTKPDPNQLLLFTPEEMSGEEQMPSAAPIPDHETEVKPETIKDTPPRARIDNKTEDSADTSHEGNNDIPTEPKTGNAPEVKIEIPSGSTPTTVQLLRHVMDILDSFTPKQQRLIAIQTATLLQSPIAKSYQYHLPGMENVTVEGDYLKAMAYVAIVRSFPNMTESIGLDWDDEYQQAVSLGPSVKNG